MYKHIYIYICLYTHIYWYASARLIGRVWQVLIFGSSRMWCLRMWCLIIVVSWPFCLLLVSVTSVSNLLLSNTTSSNATSLNSRSLLKQRSTLSLLLLLVVVVVLLLWLLIVLWLLSLLLLLWWWWWHGSWASSNFGKF